MIKITTRAHKTGGYTGHVKSVHSTGAVLWSENSKIVRATRADAYKDAEWLRDRQLDARKL